MAMDRKKSVGNSYPRILAEPYVRDERHRLGALALIAATIALMTRTRIGPMWPIAIGAVVGALGWA